MLDDLEALALDFFLSDFTPADGPHSPLRLVLRDAETTMASRKAIWLATLGYFAAVELIGRTIRKPESVFQDRRKSGSASERGFWSLRMSRSQPRVARPSGHCTAPWRITTNRSVFAFAASSPIVRLDAGGPGNPDRGRSTVPAGASGDMVEYSTRANGAPSYANRPRAIKPRGGCEGGGGRIAVGFTRVL